MGYRKRSSVNKIYQGKSAGSNGAELAQVLAVLVLPLLVPVIGLLLRHDHSRAVGVVVHPVGAVSGVGDANGVDGLFPVLVVVEKVVLGLVLCHFGAVVIGKRKRMKGVSFFSK